LLSQLSTVAQEAVPLILPTASSKTTPPKGGLLLVVGPFLSTELNWNTSWSGVDGVDGMHREWRGWLCGWYVVV